MEGRVIKRGWGKESEAILLDNVMRILKEYGKLPVVGNKDSA